MLNFLLYFFVFIFGLVIGSFLNCVIYRLEKKESALSGRSYCPHCKHQLKWYDLIPLLSFIILKGKCRYCQKPISIQYPLVELATAFLFVLIFLRPNLETRFGLFNLDLFNFVFLLIIASVLIIIFVYDLKHYIIPDKVIFPAILLVLLYQLIFNFQLNNFYSVLISAFGAATFFLIIVLVTKGKGMGIGDIKLAFLMGLLLGWPNIFVALFFAFLIGAIMGIGLILAHKKTLKSEVPFGPFLVTGTFIALFWGKELINFYLNLFY
ncbi:MAG: prepilin peptidase [Minisyncoccales bacterium]